MKLDDIKTREDFPRFLDANGLTTGIELGVATGAFSEFILNASAKVRRLYSVDMWAGDRGHNVGQARTAAERLARFGERSIVVRSTFEDFLPEMPAQSLDFVYIDGYAHTGQEGGRTLETWWPVVRPGGVFGGHDYDEKNWPKSFAAINEFRERHKGEFDVFHSTGEEKNASWFIRKIGKAAQREGEFPPFPLTDRHDENVLKHGGARGAQEVVAGLRGCPMFFRADGRSVDLLDLYAGRGVFLVLNGPSLAEQFPAFDSADYADTTAAAAASIGFDRFARLRQPGVQTIGVNNGGHEIRPDFWLSVDDPVRFMRSIWSDPRIQKFVPFHHFEKRSDGGRFVKEWPNVIGFRRNEKLIPQQFLTESTINWGNHADYGGGRSVMLAAFRVAHLLGFRRVYLLGCDFRMDETHKYFFEEERDAGAIKNNENSYKLMRGFFEQLRPVFEAAGFHVFNATPGSGLDVFPRIDLDDAIDREQRELDLDASTVGMYRDPKKAE